MREEDLENSRTGIGRDSKKIKKLITATKDSK